MNTADITVVLDRSGSMETRRLDAMNGFNALVEDQKRQPGDAVLSLVQFDNAYEVNYTEVPLPSVTALTLATYQPRGSTALLDAIGQTINAIGQRLSSRAEGDRPDKVIVVIITDGEENASKQFSRATIHATIAHQRDVYKWEFIFIGTNQDAIAEAGKIGIPMADAVQYANNRVGTANAYHVASASLGARRAGGSGPFTPGMRALAMADDPDDPDTKKPRKPSAPRR